MLAEIPGYLLAYVVRGDIATFQNDSARMAKARADGRGFIVALPHSGNWDAAAVWLVDWLGGPFMTVAERLQPESLYQRFLDYRESLGMRVVPLTGGELDGLRGLRLPMAFVGASVAGAIPFHLVREMKNAQTAGKIDRQRVA